MVAPGQVSKIEDEERAFWQQAYTCASAGIQRTHTEMPDLSMHLGVHADCAVIEFRKRFYPDRVPLDIGANWKVSHRSPVV